MKKLISLLLSVVFIVSVTGCTATPNISGKYRAEFDVADVVIDAFNGTANYEDPNFPYSKYIPSFTVALNFTFREDGTYSISADTDALQTSLDDVLTALNSMMEDMMFSTAQSMMGAYGIQVDSIDQLREMDKIVGTDWDSMVSGILGNDTMVSMNQKIIDELFDTLSTPYAIEGKFTAQDGKLCLSLTPETQASESCYFTYEEGEDGSIILTDMTGMELPLVSFPITLTLAE